MILNLEKNNNTNGDPKPTSYYDKEATLKLELWPAYLVVRVTSNRGFGFSPRNSLLFFFYSRLISLSIELELLRVLTSYLGFSPLIPNR